MIFQGMDFLSCLDERSSGHFFNFFKEFCGDSGRVADLSAFLPFIINRRNNFLDDEVELNLFLQDTQLCLP